MSTTAQTIDNSAVPRDGYRAALERLRQAQKPAAGAPAYSRFVNRPLGRRFAAMGYVAGRTPNQLTGFSAVATFSGIGLVAAVRPTWWSGLLIAFLLCLGYALDAADGQLARLQGKGSTAGEWLDHVVDSAKIVSLHLAVAVAVFRFSPFDSPVWLLVPVGFAIVATVAFFGMILNDLLRARFTARTGHVVPRPAASGLRSVLAIPTDYGLLCLVFTLVGAFQVFLWVYAANFVANVVFVTLALPKWFRSMGQLDQEVEQ